jgi:hypothetical protein
MALHPSIHPLLISDIMAKENRARSRKKKQDKTSKKFG